MMRIRLLFLACLLLPVAAIAADASVEQQGNWTLRTSTSTQMTKDYFCASEGEFARGYKMVLARNILGQTSVILTWPDFTGATGTTVPLRLSVDDVPLRDMQANLKAPGLLVIPMGWDDEALNKLTDAKHVTFTSANNKSVFDIKDSSRAFTRLNSCTASLIDRLPASDGLSADVKATMLKAGLSHTKVIQVSGNDKASDNFIVDNIFGGSTLLTDGSADLTTRMLTYVDQLELICRSRFSSELSAPMPAADGEIMTAEARCDAPHNSSATTLIFLNTDGKTRVYYFETDGSRADQAKALRDRLLQSLKS